MDIRVELYGYIESQQTEIEYAVGMSYNYGTIECSIATGGIVGGAWNPEGETIVIKGCQNTGTIKCNHQFNGGILGGTYSMMDETSTDATKNKVINSYSTGTIESSVQNQICPKYAEVVNCYYVGRRQNVSGYGLGYLSL